MVGPAASWPRTALTVTRVSRIQGRPLIRFGSMEIRTYATPEAYVDRTPAAERTASAPPITIRQAINGQDVDWLPGADYDRLVPAGSECATDCRSSIPALGSGLVIGGL